MHIFTVEKKRLNVQISAFVSSNGFSQTRIMI